MTTKSTLPLSLDVLRAFKKRCESIDDWSLIRGHLLAIFGNLDNLRGSFLELRQDEAHSMDHTCPIDKRRAQICLNYIATSLPSEIFKEVSEATQNAIRSIMRNNQEFSAQHLDAIVIIFSCPSFFDIYDSNNIVFDLLEVIARLNQPLQDLLLLHLIEPVTGASYSGLSSSILSDTVESRFKDLLDFLHEFIDSRLFTRTVREKITAYQDAPTINAIKFMAALYRLNQRRNYVPYTSFYNDSINETFEIKIDIPNFRERKGFSFCDYAFVLNPSVKADILKVENVFQMRHELQDAFFRALFEGVNSPYLVLCIRRDHIITDTLHQLEKKTIHDLKKQLRVQFVGEEGVDEGGVQKEYFQLIIRELFDPKYGMFQMNEESRLFWFCPNPGADCDRLAEFRLAGLLLGLAVYNSVILDLHLPLALYKLLMGVDVSLQDLKQLDPTLGRGLEQLLTFEGDVETEYDRTFQIDFETFGGIYTAELKPMGSFIHLTNDNRQEFVDLYVKFILKKSVEKEFQAFREGFQLLCQDNAINIFQPEEIEQLVCGSSTLDFHALEKSTVYDGGYTRESAVIQYFWEIVHDFTYEEKKKLLFFATGSDRAPIGGLGKLQFVIAKNGADSDRLPTSHTCYNVLLLCEYSSKEKLRERLLTSISNAEGFGMI